MSNELRRGDVVVSTHLPNDSRIAVITEVRNTPDGTSIHWKSLFGGPAELCGCPNCVRVYKLKIVAHIEVSDDQPNHP